jgi:hypothetical protein
MAKTERKNRGGNKDNKLKTECKEQAEEQK